jgi:hypothetical protein
MSRRKALDVTKTLAAAEGALAAANRTADAVARMHKGGKELAGKIKAGVQTVRPRKAASGGVREAPPLPTRQGYNIATSYFTVTGQSATSTCIRGQSVIGSAQVGAGGTGNSVCFVGSLNPASFSDRLGVMAQLYDKYVYRSVKLQFVPSVGTGTNGSIAMYFDRDYMDPAETASSIASIMSAENASMGPCYAKLETMMKRDPHEKRTYFTNGATGSNDPHETEQFKALAYFVNGDAVGSSRNLGTFVLSYDLELISPVIAPREFFNFAPFAFSQFQAIMQSSAFSGWLSNSTPTPWTDAHQFGIIEICISDLAGASMNTGFVWGRAPSAPAAALATGQSLFLRRGVQDLSTSVAVNNGHWAVYSNLSDAQASGENMLVNTNAVNTSVFNQTVYIWWRNVGVSRGGN